MICAVLLRALWIMAPLAPIAGTAVSGKLIDGLSGAPIGGENAFVAAYIELPSDAHEVVILGYSHPDDQGKWTLSNLPAAGKVFIAGFHRSFPANLFHAEVALSGSSVLDIGTQSILPATPASQAGELPARSSLPHLLMNRRNEEVARELMRLIAVKAQLEQAGPAGSKSIDGLWERSGRIYRIDGARAVVADAGTTLKTTVAVGDEVMRNIVRTGANTWSAEILWQKESERKWAQGTLTLSEDGSVLTRICPSPWNQVEETARFTRK